MKEVRISLLVMVGAWLATLTSCKQETAAESLPEETTIVSAPKVEAVSVGPDAIYASIAAKKLDQSKFTKLLFSDEFDEYFLQDHWNNVGSGGITSEDGILKLGHDKGTLAFLPECLNTKGKFSFRYGLVTARVKFNDDAAVWPGLWLLGAESEEKAISDRYSALDTRVEVFSKLSSGDDMELGLGWDCGNKETSLLHKKFHAPGLGKGFHEIALLWTDREYVYYLDGEEIFRTGTLEQDHRKRYLALFLKRLKSTAEEAQNTLEVDWVRVHELPDGMLPPSPDKLKPEKLVLKWRDGMLVPPDLSGYEWQLALHDDFDGSEIDDSKWTRCEDGPRKGGWWREDHVNLNGEGQLEILISNDAKNAGQYAAGGVLTRGKFEQAYGFFTAKVKTQTQVGSWPAFWLQYGKITKTERDGGRDGAEIDIFEKPRLEERIDHAIHFDGYKKHHGKTRVIVDSPGINTGFHEYSLCWTPEEYIFFIDGVETYRTNIGGISKMPSYLCLTAEIGKWAGDISRARLPDYFLVDRVRVFSLKQK